MEKEQNKLCLVIMQDEYFEEEEYGLRGAVLIKY